MHLFINILWRFQFVFFNYKIINWNLKIIMSKKQRARNRSTARWQRVFSAPLGKMRNGRNAAASDHRPSVRFSHVHKSDRSHCAIIIYAKVYGVDSAGRAHRKSIQLYCETDESQILYGIYGRKVTGNRLRRPKDATEKSVAQRSLFELLRARIGISRTKGGHGRDVPTGWTIKRRCTCVDSGENVVISDLDNENYHTAVLYFYAFSNSKTCNVCISIPDAFSLFSVAIRHDSM